MWERSDHKGEQIQYRQQKSGIFRQEPRRISAVVEYHPK